MRYDKQNKKTEALHVEIKKLNEENKTLQADNQKIKETLHSTLHEIRRFSAQISRLTEKLSRETEDQSKLNQIAQTAFYIAGMISSRLAYTDIELNPRAIQSQTTTRSGIYRKFDKAKRMLIEDARQKGIYLKLVGESRVEIDALPVFELLPFVILENAIKYSPEYQDVEIVFTSENGKQSVTIQSIGPLALESELPKLFEKGFRSSQTSSMPGEGLGLFLAKRVCEYHGIKIKAESGPDVAFEKEGIHYATFKIELRF